MRLSFGSWQNLTAVAATLLAMPGPARALDAQSRSTGEQARRIVSQPGRDVGLIKTKVPIVLKRAARAPYSQVGLRTCAAIRDQMSDLDDALGPDFGRSTTRRGSAVGTVAEMGGSSIVNGLIPFRGIVREVSGAAARRPRLAAAVNAGYARRGYLHGLLVARHCS